MKIPHRISDPFMFGAYDGLVNGRRVGPLHYVTPDFPRYVRPLYAIGRRFGIYLHGVTSKEKGW